MAKTHQEHLKEQNKRDIEIKKWAIQIQNRKIIKMLEKMEYTFPTTDLEREYNKAITHATNAIKDTERLDNKLENIIK